MSKKALIIPLSIIFVLTIGAFSAYAYGGAFGFNGADRQAVEEALTKGDYQAWQEAVGDSPLVEKITEDNFGRFVQAHQLRQSGQFDEARQIEESLGIDFPVRRGQACQAK
ncbi:MAG TPA: hypothetical protein PLX67_02800 [bacterium]|nr:hypothetical protein [bacterium]